MAISSDRLAREAQSRLRHVSKQSNACQSDRRLTALIDPVQHAARQIDRAGSGNMLQRISHTPDVEIPAVTAALLTVL